MRSPRHCARRPASGQRISCSPRPERSAAASSGPRQTAEGNAEQGNPQHDADHRSCWCDRPAAFDQHRRSKAEDDRKADVEQPPDQPGRDHGENGRTIETDFGCRYGCAISRRPVQQRKQRDAPVVVSPPPRSPWAILQDYLDGLTQWSAVNYLLFSPPKSNAVVFRTPRCVNAVPNPLPPLTLSGQVIPYTVNGGAVRNLGVMLPGAGGCG